MVNAKVNIIETNQAYLLQNNINEFLSTIDIRQVIKTEYSLAVNGGTGSWRYNAIIYYIDFEDIRDIKIDGILGIK